MSNANELRVFISSTFRDLQEEREHLVKKIFPEIRALCRERGITFTEVDLRWGLTDEDVALGQVIRTCLEEVDKCRPYFIGITGDRYGYIPTYTDIQKDPNLLQQYPWIEDAALDEMSITEMEAQYAVLRAAAGGVTSQEFENARFYFRRQHEPIIDGSDKAIEFRRLEDYQERIQSTGASIKQFDDPISLGGMIYDDLVKIIARDFADAKPPTPLDEERRRHEAFSLSRRRAYIANPLHLKRLNAHVASDDPPLIVYAESGSGKSSLFAFWAEQYRRKNPTAFVIEHYVGIGATAADHYAVIRHLCMEIKERFGREEEVPAEPAKLEKALGQWLGYAEHEMTKNDTTQPSSLVIILDGLNQLQGDALNLRWIPDVIAPCIRLVVSSTVEGTLVALEKRGWNRLGMQALSEAEREALVVRYLAEYRKSLNAEQITRIAHDSKCGHPLFLKTLLEELRLVGHHEVLDERITHYLESTGTEDLFQRVLARLEDDHTTGTVTEVLASLWCSRSGLDERELSGTTGLARLQIATMIAGLDFHLVRKDGRLTFFHDYLRRAVEKRYLGDAERMRSRHLEIADYFESGVNESIAAGTTVGVHMARELAFQLNAAHAQERLGTWLSTMPVFLALYIGETLYEVLEYWSRMEGEVDAVALYQQGLSGRKDADPTGRIKEIGRVANLLERIGHWSASIDLRREQLAVALEHGMKYEEGISRRAIGWVLYLRGAYADALGEFTHALDLFTELGNRTAISWAIGNIGAVYYSLGEYARALEYYDRQLSIAAELGNDHDIAAATGNKGLVYINLGEYDRAMACLVQQLTIAEARGDRSTISMANGNMGIVHDHRGEYRRAVECYERQLSIADALGDRKGVALAHSNMGVLYSSRGDFERALKHLQKGVDISEELGDRGAAAAANLTMGIVYSALGEYDRAIECYERLLSKSNESGDRRGAYLAIGNMGGTYQVLGAYDRALECFQRATVEHRAIGFRKGLTHWLLGTGEVLVELARKGGEMPVFLSEYLPNITGDLWQSMAIAHARTCAEECIAISDELSKTDTQFYGGVLLSKVEAAEGNREAALERLTGLFENGIGDEESAELHFQLWKLGATDVEDSPRRADHRAEALRLYQSLVEKTPKHEYRIRIAELADSPDSSL